jgi:hypothetical protein
MIPVSLSYTLTHNTYAVLMLTLQVNSGDQAQFDRESGLFIQLHDAADHPSPSHHGHSLQLGTYTNMWVRRVCVTAECAVWTRYHAADGHTPTTRVLST